ncbi:type VII secretion integral membrane protein EccD [Micromonospora sp. CPCC 205371]|nr:type VII secretion integral membrane protein EccD [Micromonospora sp. CPCC 205371]
MTVDSDIGLARVVVVAPKRRLDLALPEHLVLAALLPALLSHAGEDAVDSAGEQGGWILRRADGTLLDVGRSAVAQGVRDGELLHLVRAHTDWPEPEYDDVVEAIAAGARQGGVLWDGRVSRWTGVAAAGALVAAALAVCLVNGPDWTVPALLCLGLTVLCLGAGALLNAAAGEAAAGFAVCALGLPAAFAGGLLLLGGDAPLSGLGAPHALTACALLVVPAVAGLSAATEPRWLFMAAAVPAVAGAGAAIAALGSLDAVRAAAAVEAVLLVLLPAGPGRPPGRARRPPPPSPPPPPARARAAPAPPAGATFAAVARADVMLTGLLLGVATVATIGLVILGTAGGSAPLLIAVVSAGYLMRSRLFPTLRHRLPLLACGLTGLGVLAAGYAGDLAGGGPLWAVPALAGLAVAVLAIGMRYRNRRPSVYLGRIAEIGEILLILSVVPIACAVLGLYGVMRGVAG